MKTYQIDNDIVKDFEEIKPVANELLGIINTEEWSVGYNNLLLLQKIKEIKSGVFVQCGVFRGWTLVPALLYCKKYNLDVIVGMYHDQVLTTFKTLFGYRAVNVTLGLPFIRTSVDHGTAYDMAGKNKVDESSLIEASLLALKLIKNI